LESLPRFEVGDHFGYDFFNPTGENLCRAVVTDVLQCFSGSTDRPEMRVRLRIRKMTASEQGQNRTNLQCKTAKISPDSSPGQRKNAIMWD
jgi:hypothetical protein